MENKLYTIDEVKEFIKKNELLSLAGDEKLLSQLPKGNWIAGTTPYFMDIEKGLFSKNKIFVTKLTNIENEFKILTYNENNIKNIVTDSYENGYTIIIIPPFQKIHEQYALHAIEIEGIFNNPISGWVAGKDLNSDDTPKTFNGNTLMSYKDQAVAIHVKLPEEKFALLQVNNIFERDEKSDRIQFFNNGFECDVCLINGKTRNLSEYIKENNIDIRMPLVTNYHGIKSNISFKDIKNGKVSFYAPFFKNRTYKFPKKFTNYITKFEQNMPETDTHVEFSCNCILNYIYCELENKKIKNTTGPITFGEIGYILHNQTMVNLIISDY